MAEAQDVGAVLMGSVALTVIVVPSRCSREEMRTVVGATPVTEPTSQRRPAARGAVIVWTETTNERETGTKGGVERDDGELDESPPPRPTARPTTSTSTAAATHAMMMFVFVAATLKNVAEEESDEVEEEVDDMGFFAANVGSSLAPASGRGPTEEGDLPISLARRTWPCVGLCVEEQADESLKPLRRPLFAPSVWRLCFAPITTAERFYHFGVSRSIHWLLVHIIL